MNLDMLDCPKCGALAALTHPKYLEDIQRVRLECIRCGAIINVRTADDPEASWNKPSWISRIKYWCYAIRGIK